MHEIGHLIGGKISGYRFLYIEIFGIVLEKKNNRYRIRRYKNMPVGQCVMFHENLKKNPVFLIAGGILMNLLILILSVVIFFISFSYVLKTVCFIEIVVQGSLIFMNIFGSDKSDGRTLMEIYRSENGAEYYNRLLLIARYLNEGKNYTDMGEKVFEDIGNDMEIIDTGKKNAEKADIKKTDKKNMDSEKMYVERTDLEKTDIGKKKAGSKEYVRNSLKDEYYMHFIAYLRERTLQKK